MKRKGRVIEIFPEVLEQLEGTYRRMALGARYRPAAPGDGFGNIWDSYDLKSEANLDDEARRYAGQWWTDEGPGGDLRFFIGCCNFPTRPATVFAIEAARLMCGGLGGDKPALALLKMAVRDLEERVKKGRSA